MLSGIARKLSAGKTSNDSKRFEPSKSFSCTVSNKQSVTPYNRQKINFDLMTSDSSDSSEEEDAAIRRVPIRSSCRCREDQGSFFEFVLSVFVLVFLPGLILGYVIRGTT